MRVLLALPFVAVGLFPADAATKDLTTRDVLLSDSALRPVVTRIAANDSVRWRNQGRKPHTVVSDTRAWPSFTVRPGKSKTVLFARAGCYRYKVDGKTGGLVAVSASCGGTGTPPPTGTTGTPPSAGPVIYHYDITVTGRAHTVQRHTGDTRPPDLGNNTNGTIDLDLDWKSTYPNVALKKIPAGAAGAFVIGTAAGLFARGTSNVTFTYNHAREGVWGPCRGNFSMKTLASRTTVSGSDAPGIGKTFTFGSQALNGPASTISKRIDSECPKYSAEPSWVESPLGHIVRGALTWDDVSDPISLLTVRVQGKSTRMFFPLDRLLQGGGFTIQTGPIGSQKPCSEGGPPFCTETSEGFLVVKFVPRRG